IVARSSPCSPVTQPGQLPASSLTSAICLSPATPSNGDSANTAARSKTRCILIVDLLVSYGEGRASPAMCAVPRVHGRARAWSTREAERRHQEPAALVEHGYSMIWSARVRVAGDSVTPMVLAVLRLTTSVHRLGYWIGRSPGFAPSRILFT